MKSQATFKAHSFNVRSVSVFPSTATKSGLKADFDKNPLAGKLIVTIFGYGILNAIQADVTYFFLLFALAIGAMFWQDVRVRCAETKMLTWLMLTGFLVAVFVTQFGGAAHAVWLDNIEAWMQGAFPQSTELATLIFNVLRGFYVLYLVVSGLQVFIASRRQEGVWEACQLPLLSLLIIGIVDFVASFIIT